MGGIYTGWLPNLMLDILLSVIANETELTAS